MRRISSVVCFLFCFAITASETFDLGNLPVELQDKVFYHIATQNNGALARREINAWMRIDKQRNQIGKAFFETNALIKENLQKYITADKWITAEMLDKESKFNIEYKIKRLDNLDAIKCQLRFGSNDDTDSYFILMNRYKIYVKLKIIEQEMTRKEILKRCIITGIKQDLCDLENLVPPFLLTGLAALYGLCIDGIVKFVFKKPFLPTMTCICGIMGFSFGGYYSVRDIWKYFSYRLNEKLKRQNLRYAIAERVKYMESHKKNGFLLLPQDYQIPRISEDIFKAGLFYGKEYLKEDYQKVWGKIKRKF